MTSAAHVGRAVVLAPMLAAIFGLLSAGPAPAQVPTGEVFDPLRLDVVDSAAVVVATTLAVASGTADDPTGLEGLTHTVADAHRIALGRLPGILDVEVRVTRWSVEWTVLSTPDAAPSVERDIRSGDVMRAGLRDAIDAAQTRFSFTASTPTAEVDLEAARLFAGFGSSWSRPPRGTATSVASIGSDAAADRWSELVGARAVLVRVGPPGSVAGLGPADTTGPPTADAVPEPVWTTADRVTITREVTNVWITAAFPIPGDMDRTSLDHLVHRIEEILDPLPGDPGLIGAGTEIAQLPGGDILVVRATVLPSSAQRWEARIRSIPDRITPPYDPEFFRWERRRFRAHLLLRDARPGPRSLRIARDLIETGRVRSLADEAWALEPDDLSDAAGRLGPPRILVFGPDVGALDGRP